MNHHHSLFRLPHALLSEHIHTQNVNTSENPYEKFQQIAWNTPPNTKCDEHWRTLWYHDFFTSPENKNKTHKRAKINIPKKEENKNNATKQNSCPKRKSRLFFIMILRFGCVVAPGQNMFNIALYVSGFPTSSSLSSPLLFFSYVYGLCIIPLLWLAFCAVCAASCQCCAKCAWAIERQNYDKEGQISHNASTTNDFGVHIFSINRFFISSLHSTYFLLLLQSSLLCFQLSSCVPRKYGCDEIAFCSAFQLCMMQK